MALKDVLGDMTLERAIELTENDIQTRLLRGEQLPTKTVRLLQYLQDQHRLRSGTGIASFHEE